MRQVDKLKPCPFCGSTAIMLVEPKVLNRCVWVECTECKTTSPMLEYKADTDDMIELCNRLRDTQQKAAAFWNTRAHDHELQPG